MRNNIFESVAHNKILNNRTLQYVGSLTLYENILGSLSNKWQNIFLFLFNLLSFCLGVRQCGMRRTNVVVARWLVRKHISAVQWSEQGQCILMHIQYVLSITWQYSRSYNHSTGHYIMLEATIFLQHITVWKNCNH